MGVSLDFGLWFWGFYRGPEFGTILWSFIAFFVSDFYFFFIHLFFLEKQNRFLVFKPMRMTSGLLLGPLHKTFLNFLSFCLGEREFWCLSVTFMSLFLV